MTEQLSFLLLQSPAFSPLQFNTENIHCLIFGAFCAFPVSKLHVTSIFRVVLKPNYNRLQQFQVYDLGLGDFDYVTAMYDMQHANE